MDENGFAGGAEAAMSRFDQTPGSRLPATCGLQERIS